jgi:hypothetical protein
LVRSLVLTLPYVLKVHAGYDENDLDLDMFCRDVVHADLEHLRRMPAHNAFIGQQSTTPPADPKAAAAWAIQDVFAKIVTAR